MNTTITSERDYTKSAYWAFELELTTNADRRDIPLNLSGAEVVLDALEAHRHKLFENLEWLRDAWVKEGIVHEKLLASLATGEFARTMEQIKVCNTYLAIIASHAAAALREIGNSIPDESLPE